MPRTLSSASTPPRRRSDNGRDSARVRLTADLPTDPVDSARAAGLRYVSDAVPGITRHRRGRGFVYETPDGSIIRDTAELTRIRKLAVPPAWTQVWICPSASGHVQATGRDARRRKQYRYHPRWRATRDETKYGRMVAFGEALPRIRARVERDLGRVGLSREKVLATVVRLMEVTRIRVGNEEYARANESFGLTTLRNRHVEIDGSRLRFRFRGKSGKEHEVAISDRRLARIVERCRDLPGWELFQYLDDDGQRRSIDSADVNAYLREIAGDDFTAKDFRTWAGTVLTCAALHDGDGTETTPPTKRALNAAIVEVAGALGNTPAICRKCYVHPGVVDAYLAGSLCAKLDACRVSKAVDGLRDDEMALLAFLRELHVAAATPLATTLARSVAAAARRGRGRRAPTRRTVAGGGSRRTSARRRRPRSRAKR